MFSNLSQGSTVYVLQTDDPLKYNVCTIEQLRPSFSYNFNGGALVDIAVTIDGHRKEFSGIQANSSVSTSSNYIITDSKDAMIGQVQNIYQTNSEIVDNVEKYKKLTSQSKDLLGKLNPQFAQDRAVDTAITNLSSRVDSIQNEFGDMKADMKQILNLLTSKTEQR